VTLETAVLMWTHLVQLIISVDTFVQLINSVETFGVVDN